MNLHFRLLSIKSMLGPSPSFGAPVHVHLEELIYSIVKRCVDGRAVSVQCKLHIVSSITEGPMSCVFFPSFTEHNGPQEWVLKHISRDDVDGRLVTCKEKYFRWLHNYSI